MDSTEMFVAKLFAQCFTLYQVLGAPQQTNFPWPYPTTPTDMALRAHPNLPSFSPDPYQSLGYDPLLFAPDMQRDNSYFGAEHLDAFRQNVQECDPRNWFQRSFCYNATVRRTCTSSGNFLDIPCSPNWSCVTGLGICLRPFIIQRSFICPEAPGTYPDLISCRAYHVCQDNNTAPLTVTCFWPQVYDALTQSCQMEGPDTPCYRAMKCYGDQHIAYPGDANIYGNCSTTGVVERLNKCPVGQGWNDQTQQCEAHYCIEEGNIPADEANQYYTCSRVFRRLIRSELKNCTGTTVFSESDGICVPSVAEPPMNRITPDSPINLNDLAQTADLIQQLQESALVLNIPNGLLGKTSNHQMSAIPPDMAHPAHDHKALATMLTRRTQVHPLNIPRQGNQGPYIM